VRRPSVAVASLITETMIDDSRAKTLIVPVQSEPVNPPSRR
jgi:hypothetical protein